MPLALIKIARCSSIFDSILAHWLRQHAAHRHPGQQLCAASRLPPVPATSLSACPRKWPIPPNQAKLEKLAEQALAKVGLKRAERGPIERASHGRAAPGNHFDSKAA